MRAVHIKLHGSSDESKQVLPLCTATVSQHIRPEAMLWKAPIHMHKLHRWATVLILLPFLIVLISGLLLQVKKQFDWIQPPTQVGSGSGAPELSFQEILRQPAALSPPA
jgi:hypothetical protein